MKFQVFLEKKKVLVIISHGCQRARLKLPVVLMIIGPR